VGAPFAGLVCRHRALAQRLIVRFCHGDIEVQFVRQLKRFLGLSGLLRRSLDGPEHDVTLAHEVEFLTDYLEIQKCRFGARLLFSLDIAPETDSALVPSMLLQPLVENAVEHGVAQASHTTAVHIRSIRENDVLRLEVRDTGPGLSTDPCMLQNGVGLRNIRERLEHLYGPDGQLELLNDSPHGAVARITLPFCLAGRDR